MLLKSSQSVRDTKVSVTTDGTRPKTDWNDNQKQEKRKKTRRKKEKETRKGTKKKKKQLAGVFLNWAINYWTAGAR